MCSLSYYHMKYPAKVAYNGLHYDLPTWSINILPDCRHVAFNFAMVGVMTSNVQMLPTGTRLMWWETYKEDMNSHVDSSRMMTRGLLEHINVTGDTSHYLWYMT
ncbi:unnamed protein product, partial [Linum tenue]